MLSGGSDREDGRNEICIEIIAKTTCLLTAVEDCFSGKMQPINFGGCADGGSVRFSWTLFWYFIIALQISCNCQAEGEKIKLLQLKNRSASVNGTYYNYTISKRNIREKYQDIFDTTNKNLAEINQPIITRQTISKPIIVPKFKTFPDIKVVPTKETTILTVKKSEINVADRRTGIQNKAFQNAKWRFICCTVLLSFKNKKKFHAVRRACENYKCLADTILNNYKNTKFYYGKTEHSYSQSLEKQITQTQATTTTAPLINDWNWDNLNWQPVKEKIKEVVHISHTNPHTQVEIKNRAIETVIVITLSIIYVFSGLFFLALLANGKTGHKPKYVKSEHMHDSNEKGVELIQHIHIHLKDSKHEKKKEGEENKHEHEHGENENEVKGASGSSSSEEDDDDNSNETNSNTLEHDEDTIKSKKKVKVDVEENQDFQPGENQSEKPVNPKVNKVSVASLAEAATYNESVLIDLLSTTTSTKGRTSLESKELAKEILGLTAEGMHTGAYSLLLVNVLSEIFLDTLEHDEGPTPPGGERHNSTASHFSLIKKQNILNNTQNQNESINDIKLAPKNVTIAETTTLKSTFLPTLASIRNFRVQTSTSTSISKFKVKTSTFSSMPKWKVPFQAATFPSVLYKKVVQAPVNTYVPKFAVQNPEFINTAKSKVRRPISTMKTKVTQNLVWSDDINVMMNNKTLSQNSTNSNNTSYTLGYYMSPLGS